MHIITDSAADFTREELKQYEISCVPTTLMLGGKAYETNEYFSADEFWKELMNGACVQTSQPAPEAFVSVFEETKRAGEAVCITVSSGVSGTIQSARIAADLINDGRIQIVDSLNGTAGQKLLVLHACKLRDTCRYTASEIAEQLCSLRRRVRLLASLDTMDNLARSGRISRALANLGTLTQLKPLLTVDEEGHITLCGKAFGRHRAIDSLAKRVAGMKIDENFPVIPFFSYDKSNCMALMDKLKKLGVRVDEALVSAIGPSIGGHIGPNAYGVAFVEAE